MCHVPKTCKRNKKYMYFLSMGLLVVCGFLEGLDGEREGMLSGPLWCMECWSSGTLYVYWVCGCFVYRKIWPLPRINEHWFIIVTHIFRSIWVWCPRFVLPTAQLALTLTLDLGGMPLRCLTYLDTNAFNAMDAFRASGWVKLFLVQAAW